MTFSAYSTSLIVLACLLLYFGLYLILGRVPEKLKQSVYRHSRYLMGAAFLVITLAVAIFFIFNIGGKPAHYRAALNIGSYYITEKLFALSVITLIGYTPKLSYLKQKWSHILMMLFPLVVWMTPFIKDPQTAHLVQLFLSSIFFISIITDVVYFFKLYNQVVSNDKFFYIDGTGVHVSWIVNSVYLMISVGILGVGAAQFSSVIPQWILFLFLVYFVAICIYIFSKLIRFIIIVGELKWINEEDGSILEPDIDMSQIRFSADAYSDLHKKILEWVNSKGYCKKKVTISNTAALASTNRLYLSNYINVTYKCSFRMWVSKLRIEEAKRIFQDNPKLTITSVADQVGFQSLTSFTHAFKNAEGCSPKDWVNNSNRISL